MRFYIATTLSNSAEHNAVRDLLCAVGHVCSYDWTEHGPVWAGGKERIAEVAQAEKSGVLSANVVIVLLPGGRGTHAELGMALASKTPVILHSADPTIFGAVPETCAFYHDSLVHQVCTYADILRRVHALGGPR